MLIRNTDYDATGRIIPRPPIREARAISTPDVERCLSLEPSLRNRVVIGLLAEAGLTVRQVAELRWRQVFSYPDLPDESQQCIQVTTGRGARVEVELPVDTTAALGRLHPGMGTALDSPVLVSRDRKFQNQQPKPLTTRSIYQIVQDAFSEHVGLPLVTPMDLKDYYVLTHGNRKHSLRLLTDPFTPDSKSESSRADQVQSLASLWFSDEGDWDPG